MKPAVSVIVPIYNVEQYLSKCIESIINQTLSNIEIILVDDGSTDNSGTIAGFYEKKDSRIKVIHKKNGGQGSARNKGIEIAIGEYIGFVDSDDWVDLDMYEVLYKEAKNSCSDIAICSRKVFDGENQIKTIVKPENNIIENVNENILDYIVNQLLYSHTVVVYNKIYKSNIIKDNKIFFKEVREVGSEDALFNFQILFYTNRIVVKNKVFHNQLAREGSTARKYKVGVMKRTANLIEEVYNYANKINRKEVGEMVAPIMLIFFQQWNYNLIKIYGKDNLFNNIVQEQKEAEKSISFRKSEKTFILEKKVQNYIGNMGFSRKGRLFFKVYMMLSLVGQYKLAAKLRTII